MSEDGRIDCLGIKSPDSYNPMKYHLVVGKVGYLTEELKHHLN